MDQVRSDEIDLRLVLEKIWNSKWKIFSITVVFFIISSLYISFTPNKFKVTTDLQKSNEDLFFKYKYVNDILRISSGLNPDYIKTFNLEQTDNNEVFNINTNLIFEMFVNEFKDYEEMITILSQNDYVKNQIKNLNDKKKRQSLINFAKKFIIIKTISKKEEFWKLSFRWHDINEGSLMFNKALNLTLINVQKSLINQINNIAKSIDLENQREKSSLNVKIQTLRELNKLIYAKKTRFLIEQSNIAKELGIEKNKLNVQSVSKLSIANLRTDSKKMIELESSEYPYYLRGFKAIDKELNMLKSRNIQDHDLMMEGYLDIREKLLIIERDNRAKDLRKANETINKEDIAQWVTFNIELGEIENLKKPYLLILISIISGLMFGTIFVFLSNTLKQ